ncbi:hypothetical protein [Parasitella parasitica]|uniref:Uncharacterized protein n=1 Tax=Parasitella parasitica TaxID=35722 RepID=A0A0B7MSJ4_9FUNG|nr:hypothetical protein [Parasitella parasitica]
MMWQRDVNASKNMFKGFRNTQDLRNDKRLFWNLMQTNGYSVEFTFKKKPIKKSSSKPLTAADFCEDIKNNQVLIWGVDSGVTDIYTVADSGDASEKGKIRSTSSKEYHHIPFFSHTGEEMIDIIATSSLVKVINDTLLPYESFNLTPTYAF